MHFKFRAMLKNRAYYCRYDWLPQVTWRL